MDEAAPAPAAPAAKADSSTSAATGVTLDSCREQFYVAQRANERLAAQLKAFVASLEQQKPDDGWLEQVREEAGRLVRFHETQLQQWQHTSSSIEAYVEDVRQLAEIMAINELKGLPTEEAELPENKAKTVHPELVKFQLEKKARILGKIGGVPALGPGMAVLPKPVPGQVLKATASPAAREIYYSKVEDKDAANLAGVFQFRKAANSEVTPVSWQEESAVKNVRRGSEAAAAELKRQEEQEQQLSAGGAMGAELAGALRARQTALHNSEESEAAAAASQYRRTQHLPSGADPQGELQAATPELAEKLRRRQAEEERARRLQQQAEDEAAAAAAGGVDAQPGWNNSSAPFGSELASVLQKRRQTKEAADAAQPAKATDAATSKDNASGAETSELAQLLKQRPTKLASQH